MNAKWEERFRTWAQPPSEAEEARCTTTISEIRQAINASDHLSQRNIEIFPQGSYHNNTNVRLDSDVDVGVLCYDTFFPEYPDGTNDTTFSVSPATYQYDVFKREVEEALVNYFGRASVTRGNKAFDIKASHRSVEADVAPFFEHRRYGGNGSYLSGVELRPDNGVPYRVINWPEQHYTNGVNKNTATGHRYKALVRVLKRLRIEMSEAGIASTKPITGFLIECLMWNVPNNLLNGGTYSEMLEESLSYLYNRTKTQELCDEWGEVSELKYLFKGVQKWTREQAHLFIIAAWEFTR